MAQEEIIVPLPQSMLNLGLENTEWNFTSQGKYLLVKDPRSRANIAYNMAYSWMSPTEPGLILNGDPLQRVYLTGQAMQDILYYYGLSKERNPGK